MGILDDLRVSKEATLLYKGHMVLDSKFARVLEEVERKGSLEHDLSKLVKGYEVEVRTPIGVAKKIAKGEADVGFGVRSAAEDFDLSFARLFWESYDFAISKDSVGKSVVSDFLEIIRSDYVDDLIASIEKVTGLHLT